MLKMDTVKKSIRDARIIGSAPVTSSAACLSVKKRIYDVCVIGSGAAGGFMVKELTAAGADTILIEAGGKGRLEDLHIHDWPYDLPKRGFGLFKQASLYGDDIGSAMVGRYLSGHITAGAIGYLKELLGKDTFTGDGATDHAYIPRFNQTRGQSRGNSGYAGGWGMQMNYVTWRWPHHAKSVAGFGSSYKRRVRELQPAMFQIGAWGKVEHRAGNRVTVDPKKVDKFGIPLPVVQFNWGENDLKLFRNMRESVMEVLDTCGVETVINRDERPGGFASHEVGTCRMGADPKTSVLNSYCQSHEIKNLFVVDGSCFTTFSEKNPTLTIAALAVRSARYIAERRRRGEL